MNDTNVFLELYTLDFRMYILILVWGTLKFIKGLRSVESSHILYYIHTLLSFESLYSTHRPMDLLQYSTVNASVNSCPWPLPHRPWVSVHVTRWSSSRSISRYSLTSLLICAFGHHAPPFFSWRILKQNKHSTL